MKSGCLTAALCALAWIAGWANPVEARQWKPARITLAIDYLEIVHVKQSNDLVLVWWVAPPMLGAQGPSVKVFDDYVVLALAHAHIDPSTGTATYENGDVQVQDASNTSLKPVADADLPPVLTAGLAGLKAVLTQNLGALGKGMYVQTFAGGSVHACSPGKLLVTYAGETYSYDTPVPGCPSDTPAN